MMIDIGAAFPTRGCYLATQARALLLPVNARWGSRDPSGKQPGPQGSHFFCALPGAGQGRGHWNPVAAPPGWDLGRSIARPPSPRAAGSPAQGLGPTCEPLVRTWRSNWPPRSPSPRAAGSPVQTARPRQPATAGSQQRRCARPGQHLRNPSAALGWPPAGIPPGSRVGSQLIWYTGELLTPFAYHLSPSTPHNTLP